MMIKKTVKLPLNTPSICIIGKTNRIVASTTTIPNIPLLCCYIILALVGHVACNKESSKPTAFNLNAINNSPVNCSRYQEILEECSVLQGYSFSLNECAWPKDAASLSTSCKRNNDAIKCFKSYTKCLTKIQKTVAGAMLGTRSKFIKKVCSEKPNELNRSILDASKCIYKHRLNPARRAEQMAIAMAEAILRNGQSFKNISGDMQLKHACCTMALVKKEFLDALKPECSQHSEIMGKFVDSNLGDASGTLCPDLDLPKTLEDCSKVPRYQESNPKSKFYVMPILQVSTYF